MCAVKCPRHAIYDLQGDLYGEKLEKAIMTVTQYSMAKYTAKQGMKIAGMIFQTCSRLIELLNLQKFQNYTDKTAKLFIKLLQNTGEI